MPTDSFRLLKIAKLPKSQKNHKFVPET